ncbi:cyclic nucleotide-binding domain-containing protein [Xanthobacter autotrophicus]|uniref:Crp/Fnr family transcriptional regulator n=1 Tax=Xanthobacter TaxID=279 RepID=UPI0024AC23A9|nr:cyclic nucleotide-binding domain-containing protein [Xanthobacter autotrophicus]MDI4664442.1 cyclic nucleotide-binding domain-containing protein [Xanthobacter autotrophicus]
MSIEKDIALLRSVATFDMLNGEALRLLAADARTRTLAAGDTLFRMGETADCAYVVASGRIRLVDDHKAGAPRLLKEVGPGTLIGETALIVPTPRPVTAVAAGEVELLSIQRAAFVALLERFPDVTAKMRRAIAKRLEDTIRALDSVRLKLEDQRARQRRRR